MATNPNAIFGEALATGPRQIPLSELQQQIAGTRQTQAQTADIGAQMAQRQQETIGLQQQNALRQRQIDDEQAVRDAIAHNTTSIPVTAPNANIPTPGTDSDGNPLPLDLGYHQIAAKGAVQAPHVDYNGAYAELVGKGRFAAAETMLRSIQDRRAKDLENSKAQTALFETQNNRRNELAASVANAPPEQKAAVASQVGQQLEQEGLIAPGSGATFGPNEADVLYRSSAGAKDPIRAANAALGLTEAQAKEVTAGARKTAAEAGMSEKQLDLMNQALANPIAMSDSIDGLIDPKKYPDINARTKRQFASAMALGGPKVAEQVLNNATTHINTLEEDINKAKAEKGIPSVATEQALQFNAERRSDQSYNRASAQLEKVAQPVRNLQTRITALQDTLDQNSPAADAAVGAQLIGIINGGQAGRLNAALAERLVGGRSAWQGLLAAAQHWDPNPNAANSITANQRQQVRSLVQAFQARVTAKGKIVDDARTALDSTDDIGQHRRIVSKAQNDLEAADRPGGTPTGTQTGKTFDVTDPTGTVHHFPTQAAADTFKRLAKLP